MGHWLECMWEPEDWSGLFWRWEGLVKTFLWEEVGFTRIPLGIPVNSDNCNKHHSCRGSESSSLHTFPGKNIDVGCRRIDGTLCRLVAHQSVILVCTKLRSKCPDASFRVNVYSADSSINFYFEPIRKGGREFDPETLNGWSRLPACFRGLQYSKVRKKFYFPLD